MRWHDEPNGRGFWAVTRHADVWAVDRDFQNFSSEPTIMIPDPPPGQGQGFGPYKMMLMMDPPEHTAFRKLIRSEFPDREFNIEGNPDARFVELVEAIKPDQATLVPDDIRQATSDHGWDVAAHNRLDCLDHIAKPDRNISAGQAADLILEPVRDTFH